jgi:uncharacterized protein YlxW (UPF0749 family)
MWPWLLSKTGLRIAGAIAAALLLGLVVMHYRAKWKAEGAQEQAGRITGDAEKNWQAERRGLLEQLSKLDADRAAAQEREARSSAQAQQFAALAQKLGAQVATLAGQRQQATATVDRLPDSELRPSIIAGLGLRPPGNSTPGYTPAEERALARCVADYPLCQKQAAALGDQVNDLAGQIAATRQQVQAIRDQATAAERKTAELAGYAHDLEGFYAEAFNALPRHRTAGQFLCGLVTFFQACKPARINLPKLADIRAPRPGP